MKTSLEKKTQRESKTSAWFVKRTLAIAYATETLPIYQNGVFNSEKEIKRNKS